MISGIPNRNPNPNLDGLFHGPWSVVRGPWSVVPFWFLTEFKPSLRLSSACVYALCAPDVAPMITSKVCSYQLIRISRINLEDVVLACNSCDTHGVDTIECINYCPKVLIYFDPPSKLIIFNWTIFNWYIMYQQMFTRASQSFLSLFRPCTPPPLFGHLLIFFWWEGNMCMS